MTDWHEEQGELVKEFTFGDFKEAFAFMTKVAAIAEELQHHPTWTNTYNRLRIALSTHEAGGITAKDYELAKRIDTLL